MFRTSVLIPVLAFALCGMPLTAHADDTTKRAKVEEMLTLTKSEALAQQMLAGFPDRVKTMASRQVVVQAATTPEQKKLTADYLDRMSSIARTGADWAAVKPKVVDLYMTAYTEPELDGIIAFLKSPAGQAYVAKAPETSGKTLQILQAPINALGPQFEATTKTYEAAMQKTSPGGGSVATPKPPTLGPETPAAKPAPKK